MRGWLVVASLLSALSVSAAQQSKPVPTGSASISGRIIDADTQQIDPLPRDRAELDAGGTFHLRGVFGYRTLTVVGLTHEHVLDRVLHGRTVVKMLSPLPGESIEDVTLVVRRRD